THGTPRKSGVDPHLSELAAPAAAPLIRAEPAEFVERPDESVAQVPRRLIRILLGPASRFGDDRVDHPELKTVGRVEPKRGRGLLRLVDVAPEDRRAALG